MLLCQLATEVTGNTDTSSLREVLEILEPDELGDYEISTANISMIDKSIRIGLLKESTSISEDILKLYGTRSNTKTYQNIEGVSTLVDTLIDNNNNLVEMIIEFNSTGLVKEIGYALSTSFALDAPEGTTAQDNFQVYLERHESHKTSVNDISYNVQRVVLDVRGMAERDNFMGTTTQSSAWCHHYHCLDMMALS